MPIFFFNIVIFNAIKDYGQHLKISVVKSPTNDNNCLISFCPPFDINYFYNAKNNLTTILTDESSIEYRGTGYQLLVTNLHKDLFNQEKELYYYFESYGKINHYYLMVDPHNTKMAAVDVVFKKRCDAEKFFNENHKRDVFKCDTQVFVQNLFVFQKDFNKVMGLSNETRKQINPTFFETYDIICYAIDEKLKDDYNETYFGEWLQHFPMTHFKKLDLPTIGRVVLIKFEDPSCVDQLSDPSNFLYNNHQRYPLMLMKYDTNNDVETAIGYHGSELSRTSFQPTTIYVKPISRGQALDRADLKSYFSSFGALVYLFCKDNGSGSYISFYERDSFNKALSSNGDKYSISNRPELTRTMRDMYTMFDNKPKNVNISAFYMTKGCRSGCPTFPEYDEVMDTLKTKYPFVNPIAFEIDEPYEDRNYNQHWWLEEMFSPARIDNSRFEWPYKEYAKHNIINYFFFAMERDALKRFPEADYFLFAEDDQTYHPQALSKILDFMDSNDGSRCFAKCAWHKCKTRKFKKGPKEFIWGQWGALRSRKELEQYLRYVKFAKHFEAGDTLGSYLCNPLRKGVHVDCSISYHFGRESIPP
ncbi:hypothetical protein QTN25_009983 [Entamoeba marina]